MLIYPLGENSLHSRRYYVLHVSYLIPLSLSPEPGQGLSLQVKLRSSSLEFFSCWFHLDSELEVASAHAGQTPAAAPALPLCAAHSLCSMWAEPLGRAPEATCLPRAWAA